MFRFFLRHCFLGRRREGHVGRESEAPGVVKYFSEHNGNYGKVHLVRDRKEKNKKSSTNKASRLEKKASAGDAHFNLACSLNKVDEG